MPEIIIKFHDEPTPNIEEYFGIESITLT